MTVLDFLPMIGTPAGKAINKPVKVGVLQSNVLAENLVQFFDYCGPFALSQNGRSSVGSTGCGFLALSLASAMVYSVPSLWPIFHA